MIYSNFCLCDIAKFVCLNEILVSIHISCNYIDMIKLLFGEGKILCCHRLKKYFRNTSKLSFS